MSSNSVLVVLAIVCIDAAFSASSSGETWVSFSNNCYQLVQKPATWDEAKELCKQLDKVNNSTLAMIKSPEEQDFIVDYFYNKSGIIENVWLGGRRENESSDLKWIDGSDLTYQHLRKDGLLPGNKNCLQMISSPNQQSKSKDKKNGLKSEAVGDWSNTECSRHNYVTLCQKSQNLDFDKLVEMFNELREQFRAEKKYLEDKIENIKFEPKVPINAVYVQYPFEKEPSQLWNCSKDGHWVEISDTYSNLFFRVLGDKSNSFDSVQEESSKNVDLIKNFNCKDNCPVNHAQIRIKPNDWSDNLWIASAQKTGNDIESYLLQFHSAGGEVRPRNMAIKLWKCVN